MREAALEKNVELPSKRGADITSFGEVISLLATMDKIRPGESFVIDEEWMRKRALMAGKQKGVKLTSRKEGKRYRVWRKIL